MAHFRGSQWRKWDLHVHSPDTHLGNNYSGISNRDFIDKVKEEGLKAIGLTNYFNFVQGDFVLKEDLEKEGVTVFLNLELRLAYNNKEDQCCDIHIIFDDSIIQEDIEDFLIKLNVDDRGEGKMARDLKSTEEFSMATVEFKELLQTLNEESLNLQGRFLIGFLSRGKGNSRSSARYEEIAKKSNFLIHSSDKEKNIEEDRDFWLEKEKPLLQSSDAHERDTIGSKFTWIKADPTFEGLKQIIYEPKDRIKIQELKPEEKPDYAIIDRIEYKNIKGGKEEVFLNQNLNSLIGSRATGKSNILKNIAYTVDPKQCKEKGVYMEGDNQDFLPLKNLTVFWRDGEQNLLNETDGKNRGILFIPQRFLGEIVYEKGRPFNDFLSSLFENNDDFRVVLQQYKSFEDENVTEIHTLIRSILSAKEEVEKKEERIKKLGKLEDVKKEIKRLEKRISKIKKTVEEITDEELKEYRNLINKKRIKIAQLEEVEKNIKSLKYLQEEQIITLNIISDLEFSEEYREKIEKTLQKSECDFKENFVKHEIQNLEDEKERIEKEVLKTKEEIEPLQEKVKKNKSLLKLTEDLEKQEKTKSKIEELQIQLENLRKEYKKEQTKIVQQYLLFEDKHDDFNGVEIGEFKFSTVKIVSEFDMSSLEKFATENINRRDSVDFREKKEEYKEANIFLDNSQEWEYGRQRIKNLLKELMAAILSEDIILKAGKSEELVLIELFRNRYKIDFLRSVKSPKRGGDEFITMSDGQKMMVLLEFVFEFDNYNYPVLLDQPEDDLDAKVIATEVVDFLKNQKEKRQVIIASHNANLVVVGDSENILVAEKSGRESTPKFTYETGSIENVGIKKQIIAILEGGDEALKKRKEKLNI